MFPSQLKEILIDWRRERMQQGETVTVDELIDFIYDNVGVIVKQPNSNPYTIGIVLEESDVQSIWRTHLEHDPNIEIDIDLILDETLCFLEDHLPDGMMRSIENVIETKITASLDEGND
jgi:hypothetical protein